MRPGDLISVWSRHRRSRTVLGASQHVTLHVRLTVHVNQQDAADGRQLQCSLSVN